MVVEKEKYGGDVHIIAPRHGHIYGIGPYGERLGKCRNCPYGDCRNCPLRGRCRNCPYGDCKICRNAGWCKHCPYGECKNCPELDEPIIIEGNTKENYMSDSNKTLLIILITIFVLIFLIILIKLVK